MRAVRTLHLMSIILILAVLVVIGLYFARDQKQRTADERRVRDVLSLSWRIVEYDHVNGVLPTSLENVSEFDKVEIPHDPKSGVPYEYKRIGEKAFRLCAIFSKQSKNFSMTGGRVMYGDPITHGYGKWSHEQGLQCLDRRVPSYR